MRFISLLIKIQFQMTHSLLFCHKRAPPGNTSGCFQRLNPEDMDQVAEAISMTLHDFENSKEKAKEIVKSIVDKYPLY